MREFARHPYAQASNGDPGSYELVSRPQCRRQDRRIHVGDLQFSVVDTTKEQLPPGLEVPRMCGIDRIPVLFQRRACVRERTGRPSEIPRDQRDLGFGDGAHGAGHDFVPTERPRRTPHERPGPLEIAELRHGDAPKGKGRRIVAQRDALQGTEGIAGSQCARRGSDQRVHPNPVTLVTPTPGMGGVTSVP